MIKFTVPGRPIPAVRMTRKSMYVNKYAKRYLAYKHGVAWIGQSVFKGEPSEGPIGVNLNLYIHGGNHGDIDNYAKSITDALNKILYKDDKQIVSMNLRKHKCGQDEQRVEVEVYEVNADSEIC